MEPTSADGGEEKPVVADGARWHTGGKAKLNKLQCVGFEDALLLDT